METVTINSIEDARRYAIKLLDEAILEDVHEIMEARRLKAPVNYQAYYDEIARFEKIIEHHKNKLA